MTNDRDKGGKTVSEDTDPNAAKEPNGDDIGKALRTAYDQALNEDVPEELLDLLGKLK